MFFQGFAASFSVVYGSVSRVGQLEVRFVLGCEAGASSAQPQLTGSQLSLGVLQHFTLLM